MKKLSIVWFALLLATSVSAQWHRGGYYRGGFYARPQVRIGIGIGVPVYPYYGYYSPFYAYPPFGYGLGYGYRYPYGYGYGNGYRPSKLDLQIQEIRNDYDHQIWMVRHDKSIKRKERKIQIRELEHQRDQAIIKAKKDYYEKPPRRHNFKSNSNNY